MWRVLAIALMVLAGCVQIQPSPQEIEAKRFEIVPGKAVIYIARTNMDSSEAGSLILDDNATITTYKDTFYRWVVDPGQHRIAGFAGQSGLVVLNAEAGRTYYVEHSVRGNVRYGVTSTNVRLVEEKRGQWLVQRSGSL